MNDEIVKAGLDCIVSVGKLAEAVRFYVYGPKEKKYKVDKDTILIDRRERKGKKRRRRN
jgi:hypothetical protein